MAGPSGPESQHKLTSIMKDKIMSLLNFRRKEVPSVELPNPAVEAFLQDYSTAARLNADGYKVMPHFPARIIKDAATLENWINMYQGEADVKQALLLAGGVTSPHGDFSDSMQLMDSGLFDKYGFERLHIAGHPEGNRDIDTDGTRLRVDDALRWKQGFSDRTDAKMAIATQFAFEAQPKSVQWT